MAEQCSLKVLNGRHHAQHAYQWQCQGGDNRQCAIAVRHNLRQEEDGLKNCLRMGMVTYMNMAMDNNHTVYHMFMGKQGDTSEVNCKQQQKEIAEEPKMSFFFCQYFDDQKCLF